MKVSTKIYLSITLVVYLLVSININFGKNKWQDVLESDAWGYYAYLPAVFIYHDLNFSFYEKVMHEGYFESRLAYEYRVGHGEQRSNKYFCGTAIMISPFFLTAHVLSDWFDAPQDGYNRMYILSVNMAAVFYTILGLYFTGKLLQLYSHNQNRIAFVLLVFAFGTQLFYYAIGEPGMSHVYSFCALTFFLWQTKLWFQKQAVAQLMWAAFALGLVFLIRPFNLLVLGTIPFLAGTSVVFKQGVKSALKQRKMLLSAFLVFSLIAGVQSLIYYLQTGHLWIDSYPGENFDFTQPHVFESLFSFRKGLFVYTPVVLLSQLALVFMFKENRFMAITYLFFFFTFTYVLSSWWIWYYGGSFSLRPFIEYFALFAILLLWLLEQVRYRLPLMAVALLMVLLCQIQTYQYRYFIIHWSEMNQQKYFESLENIFKG